MERREYFNKKLDPKFVSNALMTMPGGFFIYRATGSEEILYANEALLHMLECDTEEQFLELTGGTFPGLVYSDDIAMVEDHILSQIEADEDRFDQVSYRVKTRTGRLIFLEDYGRYIDDPSEGPLFYVFVASGRNKYDGLTGLPRDWHFFDLAKEGLVDAYITGRRPVVLAFNFVGMKGFNNKYGRSIGDRLLCDFAKLLVKFFGNNHVARFGEDHFYAYTAVDDIEAYLSEFIMELHELNEGRSLPVKIGICEYDREISVEALCEHAMIACNSRKKFYGSDFVWYDDNIATSFEKKEYILTHIDKAINQGWLQVYFQPVVRALSEQLCSFESLVRWIDPTYGMISPGEFIPLMEANGLSHKVDRFVVNEVARLIQKRVRNKLPIAPVSINISRTDFDTIDPVEMFISVTDDYNLPRSLFYVEITESALTEDNGVISRAIERFHQAGFQVWMDDFGSGYSSLNVLKNYDFDEIKIDMIFLRNFDERSKQIIKSAVKMAKKLGIHTLAEGVENKEHLEFLSEIGCEKIQGFYFGKPAPLLDALENLQEKGIEIESKDSMTFYNTIGLVEVPSEVPYAMFAYDGSRFDSVFENSLYRERISISDDKDVNPIEWSMNSNESGLSKRFRSLADKAIESESLEEMVFVARDRYYNFSFKMIAAQKDLVMLEARINPVEYEQQEKVKKLDLVVRNLVSVFDSVYLIDLDADTRTVISSSISGEEIGSVTVGLHDFYANYKTRHIFFEDMERFSEFTKREDIAERLDRSGRGNYADQFRIREADGSFSWKEFLIVSLPESGGRRFLTCVKPGVIEDQDDKLAAARRLMNQISVAADEKANQAAELWYALVRYSGFKVFWKDADRRFLGASNEFLQYYGFKSEAEIIGKTDEDIGWHLNDAPFRQNELDVLHKGKVILNAAGENVVDGVVHNILASKFPVYKAGKIVGLAGYFIDIDRDMGLDSDIGMASVNDEETGLMNTRGLLAATLALDDNYRINMEDYVFLALTVPEFDGMVNEYGDTFSKSVIHEIANIISNRFSDHASISRTQGCRFGLSVRINSLDDVIADASAAMEDVENIKKIQHRSVRMHLVYGLSRGSEEGNVREVVELAYQRLAEKTAEFNGVEYDMQVRNRIDPYNELPRPFIVVKPITDRLGKRPMDMEFVYVNQKFCSLTGKSKKELVGNRYLKVFPNATQKWAEYAFRAGRGENIKGQAYGSAIGGMLDFVASPASTHGYAALLFDSLADIDDGSATNQTRKMKTQSAIVSIISAAESVIDFSDTINIILSKIGEAIGSDRVYVVQTDRITMSLTYEWTADGIKSVMASRQNEEYRRIAYWENILDKQPCIRQNEIMSLKKTQPNMYNMLRSYDVYNYIYAPLYVDGFFIGYLATDNFNLSSEIDPEMILLTMAKIISAKLVKKNLYVRKSSEGVEEFEAVPMISERKIADSIVKRVRKILEGSMEYEEAMNMILETLSKEIHADRINIFEIDNAVVNETFEWTAPGVQPVIKTTNNIPYDMIMKNWERMLEESDLMLIEDVEAYREANPNVYNYLKDRNIQNIVAAPFYSNGKVRGHVGVDNFRRGELNKISHILEAVTFLIGAKINNHFYQYSNSFDELTGVHNRNAMMNRREEIMNMSGSVGVVFTDLNGLKKVNDEKGHEAGDRFIKSVANILIEIYGKENIFRRGGDEFMVLLPKISREDFEDKAERLKKRIESPKAPKFSIGASWKDSVVQITDAIKEADKRMYEDKERFYSENERYRK